MIIDRNSSTPIHAQLREWIISQIDQYAVDCKLPTEYELARKFGISRLTVHKVMAELQRSGYLVRRRGRGTYVLHPDKRIHTGSESKQNGTIIVAFPDWFSYDIWAKVNSAECLSLKHGIQLVNFKLSQNTEYEALLQFVAQHKQVRGVILIPPGGAVLEKDMKLLDALDIPVVVLSAWRDVSLTRNIYTVSQDFLKTGYLDVLTLVTAGHRDIGYVAAEPWFYGSELTYTGMKKGLSESGISLRNLKCPGRHTKPWQNSIRRGYEITRDMLAQDNLTACVFDSYTTLVAGIRAIAEHGGGKIETSVVVNAAYFGLESYVWPPVTLIASSHHEIVGCAFNIILEGGREFGRDIRVDVKVSTCQFPDPS